MSKSKFEPLTLTFRADCLAGLGGDVLLDCNLFIESDRGELVAGLLLRAEIENIEIWKREF